MDIGKIQQLIELNSRLKEENEQLKIRVKELEEKLNKQNLCLADNTISKLNESTLQKTFDKALLTPNKDLTLAEYTRYGRQLILPGFGKSGILKK
jgi:hypothetical protein